MKLRRRDYKGAINDYDIAIELSPNQYEFYDNRGNAKDLLGDHIGAIDDYTSAININPFNPNAFYNRGLAKSALKNYISAIDDFESAIKLDSKHVLAYVNMGDTKCKLDDFIEAIKDYTAAIKIDQNLVGAYINRGTARKEIKDYDAAIVDYKRAIDLNSRYSCLAYSLIGDVKNELSNFGEAIDYYTLALKIFPDIPWIYFKRGIAKIKFKLNEEGYVDLKIAANLGYSKAIEILKDHNFDGIEIPSENIEIARDSISGESVAKNINSVYKNDEFNDDEYNNCNYQEEENELNDDELNQWPGLDLCDYRGG
jgi:tetratricopeptide (TPR) repeat protein